ncbi:MULTISPECIES: hypothetical protein [unclassified Bradyrhizobium]|uniref:hypothetical protein n=1 Tax=unclassified Bradyrhizobium TaxID=2631580 RepID=UPI002916DC23|nr:MULTISPECIES: hypothetical protein [unclassified Bradyrhizobium]
MPSLEYLHNSTNPETSAQTRDISSESPRDDFDFDLNLDNIGGETDEEVIAALEKMEDEPASAVEELSKNVSAPVSKIVSKPESKNVSGTKRRSPENDRKTVAKMRSFRLPDAAAGDGSLVSYPSPPILSAPSPSPTQSKPSNDNLPVWSLTGELVTAVCAAAALLIEDNPAIAFTFNLTPEAIENAKRDPAGFLDPLKRSFDQNLRRAGITLPYFFALDIDEGGRLHLHGAFRYPAPTLSSPLTDHLRQIMKTSWGEWTSPGKHKQLHFQPLRDDDWATYCLRNAKAVQKAIGHSRTFTITQPLGRDACWCYEWLRSAIRSC